MHIGLALSGGGIRGAAHIGVLQALEEENIKISHISGTSSGSIIATLYALGYTPKEMAIIFNTYCKLIAKPDKLIPLKFIKSIFTGKINIKGFSTGDNLEKIMYKYCYKKGMIDISQVITPLAIPTVDLKSEKTIYYLSRKLPNQIKKENCLYKYYGSLSKIVRASCSLPAVFIPKNVSDMILIDGGVANNTPVSILKDMGADFVIAVSFGNTPTLTSNYNIVSVTLKAFEIMGQNLDKDELNLANINILPNVKNGGLLDCSKVAFYINEGYVSTKKMIKEIKDKINSY